jgi:hypothetical protein
VLAATGAWPADADMTAGSNVSLTLSNIRLRGQSRCGVAHSPSASLAHMPRNSF